MSVGGSVPHSLCPAVTLDLSFAADDFKRPPGSTSKANLVTSRVCCHSYSLLCIYCIVWPSDCKMINCIFTLAYTCTKYWTGKPKYWGRQKVVKSDKCMGVSQLFHLVGTCPVCPQGLRLYASSCRLHLRSCILWCRNGIIVC